MTNDSGPRDGPLIKRRTTVLFAAGALAGLFSGSSRSHAEPDKTTAPPAMTAAPERPDLKSLGPAHQVSAIGYRGGVFQVTTRDGRKADFPEMDLRFKVDASATGPVRGTPVILPAKRMSDRASILFAAPDEISTFIEPEFRVTERK